MELSASQLGRVNWQCVAAQPRYAFTSSHVASAMPFPDSYSSYEICYNASLTVTYITLRKFFRIFSFHLFKDYVMLA
jgi:hypothetical protein